MIIAILAWSGAALSCLLTLPQAIRTLRMDRLDAISATTYWIVLGNAGIWAAWSVLTQQYAAGVPALVNGPAAVLILRRLHRTNRSPATPESGHANGASARRPRTPGHIPSGPRAVTSTPAPPGRPEANCRQRRHNGCARLGTHVPSTSVGPRPHPPNPQRLPLGA
jgi:uncharacterized protein with PQ loop repeat